MLRHVPMQCWRFHCAGIYLIVLTRHRCDEEKTGAPHPQTRVRFAKLGTVPENNKREGSPPNDS